MNIEEQLLLEHSKNNTMKIINYLAEDKSSLEELINCFFSDTYRVNQRSAMAVSAFVNRQPELMKPYLSKIIVNLNNFKISVGVKRNSLQILQFLKISEEH